MSEVEIVTPENPLSTNEVSSTDAFPPLESEVVHHWKVACAGDETRGLGHPKVWLQISPEMGYVDCGYCDKRFVIDPDHVIDDH